jgi:uncharacterized protein (DUF2147 family)
MLVETAMLVLAAAAPTPASGPAAAPDPAGASAGAVTGDWLVEDHDAVIHIERSGEEFVGRIVWLEDDRYTEADGPDLAGQPLRDHKNPDPRLRSRPLLGLPILTGLRYDGKGGWVDGHVYNLEDGRTYGCRLSLEDADHLRVRGYIGIPLLGGTSVWERVRQVPPR